MLWSGNFLLQLNMIFGSICGSEPEQTEANQINIILELFIYLLYCAHAHVINLIKQPQCLKQTVQ